MRLRSSLADDIEAYRIDNDLSRTEAFTAILERGLESIEPCSKESSDHQLQTDKLTCEVAALRKMVENLVDRSNRPVTKPKKGVAQSDESNDDYEYQQHGRGGSSQE